MSRLLQGIGILFDIDELGGGFYKSKAWRILMKHLEPSRISGTLIMDGDTQATLNGRAREFCIALDGVDTEYIKTVFAAPDEKGLSPRTRRFIHKPQLDSEPLVPQARIDVSGKLVTDSWTRTEHDLCKEAGWGYKPGKIPDDLSAELRRELNELSVTKIEQSYLFLSIV